MLFSAVAVVVLVVVFLFFCFLAALLLQKKRMKNAKTINIIKQITAAMTLLFELPSSTTACVVIGVGFVTGTSSSPKQNQKGTAGSSVLTGGL